MHGKLPGEVNYLDLYRFIERQYRRGTASAEGLGIQLFAIMEQISATQHHRRLAANASSHYLAAAILDLLQSHYPEELTPGKYRPFRSPSQRVKAAMLEESRSACGGVQIGAVIVSLRSRPGPAATSLFFVLRRRGGTGVNA
jgi:hypothetical protein